MRFKNTQLGVKVVFFSFVIILISMIFIDGIWLALMLKRLYVPTIGHLLSDSMKISPAIFFYILYAFALNVFVCCLSLKNNTGFVDLLLLGFLFGMVTYGTYDLTNQATLKNWPWMLTAIDIAWGSFLTALVSLISTYSTRYFFV